MGGAVLVDGLLDEGDELVVAVEGEALATGKLMESANMLMNVFGRSHPRAIKVVAALRGLGGLVDSEEAREAGCAGKGNFN